MFFPLQSSLCIPKKKKVSLTGLQEKMDNWKCINYITVIMMGVKGYFQRARSETGYKRRR
jgi:hypothetical protein